MGSVMTNEAESSVDDSSLSLARKAELRRRIRESRSTRSASQRERDAEGIAEHGGYLLRGLSADMPLLIAAYLSREDEPGTDALLERAHRDHDAIWVPRVREGDLEWVAYRPGAPIEQGPFGVREPHGTAVRPTDLPGLDVMFVPALAVDAQGHRLGQGGGYYDRTLARMPRNVEGGPLIVVVVLDDEILDEVPVEEHDRAVDVALTPSGIVDLG